MTKRQLLPVLIAATLACSGGCSMMKKSTKTKEDTSIAGATEESLKTRWVEKRAAELVAQGVVADAARAQAAEEFRAKFPYMGAAKK